MVYITGQSTEELAAPSEEGANESGKLSDEGKIASYDDYMTPAERRYIEQREKIDIHRMAKEANKSHRDRIQDFNQYWSIWASIMTFLKLVQAERSSASAQYEKAIFPA